MHADPGAHHLQRPSRPLRFVQPPAQKRAGLAEPFRSVLGHEELAAGVDGAKSCAAGVPRCVYGGVPGQKEDLVGEEGEFAQGGGEVCGEGEEG